MRAEFVVENSFTGHFKRFSVRIACVLRFSSEFVRICVVSEIWEVLRQFVAPRVVCVVRETRTEVKRVRRVRIPLYSEVTTDIVSFVCCVSECALSRERVRKVVHTFNTLVCVTVCVWVHYVTTHSDYFLLADIEINAKTLWVVYTLVASETTEAIPVAVCKSEVVSVVCRADKRDLIIIPKSVYVVCDLVTVVCTVAGFHCSEPTVFHSLFYGEVYHCFIFAVVNTRHTCQVALAVHNLQFIHHAHG